MLAGNNAFFTVWYVFSVLPSTRYVVAVVLSCATFFLPESSARELRHIADPLNLVNTVGIGFDHSTLKVGAKVASETQSLAINSNFSGDKWALSYLYVSPSTGTHNSSLWNVTAAVHHGKTDTEQGRFSHYQYQIGIIKAYQGWLNTTVFNEFTANFLDVNSIENNDSLAAKYRLTVLKPWDENWYNVLTSELTASIDGSDRFGGLASMAVGYQLTDQWSWELGYEYQIDRLSGLSLEETKWLFAVRTRF